MRRSGRLPKPDALLIVPAMSEPSASSPASRRPPATVAGPGGPTLLAPDPREIGGLAVAALAVVVGYVTGLGERMVAPWLPAAPGAMTQADALLLVAARFAPWLLGLAIVSVLFGRRWLPRMQQRMLEPSLVASWLTVLVSAGLAWLAMQSGIWPLPWQTTTPETLTLLTRFTASGQMLAVVAWVALACLLVPLLSELFLRHALLSWLQTRGVSARVAVIASAVLFGAAWFVVGVQASPAAAVRHGLVACVGGLALGALAVYGARGRGLGLCVLAHGAWMATAMWLLLRTLP